MFIVVEVVIRSIPKVCIVSVTNSAIQSYRNICGLARTVSTVMDEPSFMIVRWLGTSSLTTWFDIPM